MDSAGNSLIKDDEQTQLLKALVDLATDIRMLLVYESLSRAHCIGSATESEQLKHIRSRLSQEYMKSCRIELVPCEAHTTSNQTDL